MLYRKNCKYCGAEFETTAKLKQYCTQSHRMMRYFYTDKGRTALRRALRRSSDKQSDKRNNRWVEWADWDKIHAIYEGARRLTIETGIKHEVDHIIPLQGKTVSGLHTHENMRVITRAENNAKRNIFVDPS